MSEGQGASGQLAENQAMPRSNLRTPISTSPHSSAVSFLPSWKARVLTVDNASPFNCEYLRATARSWSIPVMEDVSAILPQMSTAILPKDKGGTFGYSTDMNRDQLLEWIDRRLKVKGLNDSAASIKAGHRDAIRNIRRARALPKIETIRALAEVLGEPPEEIGAASAPPANRIPTLDELRSRLAEARRSVEELETTISTLERWQQKAG